MYSYLISISRLLFHDYQVQLNQGGLSRWREKVLHLNKKSLKMAS